MIEYLCSDSFSPNLLLLCPDCAVDAYMPASLPMAVHRHKSHTSPVHVSSHVPILPHLPPEPLQWNGFFVSTTPTSASRIVPAGQQYPTLEWVKMRPIQYLPPLAPSSFFSFEVKFTPNGLHVTSYHPDTGISFQVQASDFMAV